MQVYNIIVTFLSLLTEISFDQIVAINNTFNGTNLTPSSIRDEIRNRIGDDVYQYLDEALLKSLSGSFSALKQITISEDYSGCLTGIFKTLEGYLTKILVQKFDCTIKKNPKFSMFYRPNGSPSNIDNDITIPLDCKQHLNKLYMLYNSKRNVYLHATIDPSVTSILPTLQEAQNIADDIINEIAISYKIFIK